MDSSLLSSLRGSEHEWLTPVMRVTTDLGGAVVLNGLFVLALVALLVRGRRRQIVFLVLASPGSVALIQLVKHTVNRSRPSGAHLALAQGASWPSGHASSSAALYGAILLIALSLSPSQRPPWERRAAIAATAVVIALVGVSRVYLSVHYPTDVLAAWLLIGVWLATLVRQLRLMSGQPQFSPRRGPSTQVTGSGRSAAGRRSPR